MLVRLTPGEGSGGKEHLRRFILGVGRLPCAILAGLTAAAGAKSFR